MSGAVAHASDCDWAMGNDPCTCGLDDALAAAFAAGRLAGANEPQTRCTCGYGGYHEPENEKCKRAEFRRRRAGERLDELALALREAEANAAFADDPWRMQADRLLRGVLAKWDRQDRDA